MEKIHPLIPYVKRFRWRLRLRDGFSYSQQTLWLAVLACVLILFVGRLFPIEFNAWVWAPLLLWMVGNIGYALLKPQSILRTALRVDNELRLKERLSNSLFLDATQVSPVYAAFDPALIASAHQDALLSARTIHPSADFPLQLLRRPLYFAAGLLAVAMVLNFLPNPMDAIIAERKAVAEEAKRQAAVIEKMREEIAQAEEMSPEEREELLKKLAELAQQLHANQGDREQALADLSRLEESLRQKLDPKGDQRRAALEAMAAQLQALAKNQNPQIGDLEAAAKATEQLTEQMESMSEEERKALAGQLADMAARAAQAGDGALAQALASMAQAAQSGDMQAAKSAAQQAAQSLTNAQSGLADQKALSQTLSQLQNSRQSLNNSSQQGQRAQGQGQQGQGQQGQGQGQGQGQQVGGGGGTNANNLPPSTRTGKAGDPTGEGTNAGTGNLDSQVYVPREKLPGNNGDELFVPGQDSGEGETQTSEKPDPLGGLNNPSLVPYNAVFQQYQDAANQALDQSTIPPGLKDYIRLYFSQLEP